MKINLLVLSILLCAFAGCNNALEEDYRKERSEQYYTEASQAYSAGNIDSAISLYEKAVKSNPANMSARFQLAVLLEDHRNDYLAAMCHYREYLMRADKSDKADSAKMRLQDSERKFIIKLKDEHKLGDIKDVKAQLDEVNKKLLEAEKKNDQLNNELLNLQQEFNKVKNESENKSKQIRRMADVDEDDLPTKPASLVIKKEDAQELATPVTPAKVKTPKDEEIAGSTKANLESVTTFLDEEDEELGTTASNFLPPKIKDDQDVSREEDKIKKPSGTPKKVDVPFYTKKKEPTKEKPKFHTVKQGETLYKIAEQYYGSHKEWTKIREANKLHVKPNGDVKAGTKLKIP